MKDVKPIRRNPIAEAHSLRGPAGSGYHRDSRERRAPARSVAYAVCSTCGEVLVRGFCPVCAGQGAA